MQMDSASRGTEPFFTNMRMIRNPAVPVIREPLWSWTGIQEYPTGWWYGGRNSRYDPDGKLERQITVPAKQTSSLNFGGPELSDIFITSASKSEITPVTPLGYDAESGYFGGALFHINVGIQGKLENKTRLDFPTEPRR